MDMPARSAPRGRATCAFTLVEMLVVIGVISVLAGMLLVVLGRATHAPRLAACGNNLRQIYAGACMFSTVYGGFLPDPHVNMTVQVAGVWIPDSAKCWARYVESHHVQADPRGAAGPVTKVPAGLWLLRTTRYIDADASFYCPEIGGPRRFNGSENKLTDGIPVMVGYAYNFFPHLLTGDDAILFPDDDPPPEDITNKIEEPRDLRFYALLSDLFLRSDQMSHKTSNGINCLFWDGSLQLVDLTTRRIKWNSTVKNDDNVDVPTFTTDRDGAIAVRDSWVLLSGGRR